MRWASLHGHTTFSLGDGHQTPRAHLERGKQLGMTHMAFTEHRNISSWVQAEQHAAELEMHAIFGCEFDVALPGETRWRHFHQTVLAMDEEGVRSLFKLVGLAWRQAKYRPRLFTDQLLDPALTRGLIVLSGCSDSWLSCTAMGGKSLGPKVPDWDGPRAQAARELAERYQEVYGDRYYLEVQQFTELDRCVALSNLALEISRVTGIEYVVTGDVHYTHPGDNEVQKVLHGADRGKSIDNLEAEWEYSITLTYPTSDAALYRKLRHQGFDDFEARQAILTSERIAQRCTAVLPKSQPIRYPCERIPRNLQKISKDSISDLQKQELDIATVAEFRRQIEEGIDRRLDTNPAFAARWFDREQEYLVRTRYEDGLIVGKGFPDYFLVVADIVRWAKEEDGQLVGPGRGSAAGSLICYQLGITEVDPLAFPGMMFERFIDPSRPDMPDIDLDFSRPAAVFAYAARKYGAENVAHILNFDRYRGKTALNDVAAAYRYPFGPTKELTRLIVDRGEGDARENDSVEDMFAAFPSARAIVEQYPGFKLAPRLEGDLKKFGTHAAGLVISTRPIDEVSAMYWKRDAKSGRETETVAFDKRDVEYLDLLKIDALGLTTMAIIEEILRMRAGQITAEQLYALPFDDPEVLRGFADGDLTGIFQFEGRTTRSIVGRVFENYRQTDEISFMVLADINALSRPGALISGMTDRYCEVELGQREPASYHPVVDAILASTNGCLVYQEQVMAIARDIGGFPGAKVGAVRRIIGKKKQGGAFEAYFEEFRDGAARLHGMSEEQARQLWDWMAAGSSYLFNIPHAVCYAVIAYWSMYLKRRYPTEFFCAALRWVTKSGEKDPTLSLLQDADRHGITILPPDPHRSEENWIVDMRTPNTILAGFSQLPGIGTVLAGQLVTFRDEFWEEAEAHGWSEEVAWSDLQFRKGKTGRKTLPDEPNRGCEGFGKGRRAKAEGFCAEPDPFKIHFATRAVEAVMEQLGEFGLAQRTDNAATLPAAEGRTVVFVGLVQRVEIIDVVEEERRRNPAKTAEQIRAELDRPELTTRAKLKCFDEIGTEVHVTVSRYGYPALAEDIGSITEGIDVIHAVGKARKGYGPGVGARELSVIDMAAAVAEEDPDDEEA